MSALPDLRLQATPEVKSKAKQPAKAPEPSKNGASSFAEVYAKERQAKPGAFLVVMSVGHHGYGVTDYVATQTHKIPQAVQGPDQRRSQRRL